MSSLLLPRRPRRRLRASLLCRDAASNAAGPTTMALLMKARLDACPELAACNPQQISPLLVHVRQPDTVWAMANGGREARRIIRFSKGGGRSKSTLQNHFWRPQNVGLVWSAPISWKGSDRARTNWGRGEFIIGVGIVCS